MPAGHRQRRPLVLNPNRNAPHTERHVAVPEERDTGRFVLGVSAPWAAWAGYDLYRLRYKRSEDGELTPVGATSKVPFEVEGINVRNGR